MRAAIYCRVSTEDQEREGSSLDTQLAACRKKATELGYEVSEQHIIREVYSGLSLERPKLDQLRQWLRNKEISGAVVYSTDRLSRDPLHLLLLVGEFDGAKAPLVFVTEPLDNSMEGQLLGYVRGWASKLEAFKIRERSIRGKRQRAREGRLPAANHARLYGYIYIRGKGKGEGIRQINEQEAKWVREMYSWLVEERLSSESITNRLRGLGIRTPSGRGYWVSSTVKKILKNPAYCGRTYAFTCTYGEPKFRLKPDVKRKNTGIIRKPREEWIEIPGATPAIISEELYNAAQDRLAENRKMALRNSRRQYLLHGHIYCQRCSRAFWGSPGIKKRRDKQYCYPFYQCSGKLRKVTPVKCDNRRYNAKQLESTVWREVEKILSQPEVIFDELAKSIGQNKANLWEKELEGVKIQLKNRGKQKDRAWKAYEITGDEDKFREEIAAIDREIIDLQNKKSQLESQILSDRQFTPDISDIQKACQVVASNLGQLSFEDKRLALDALKIRILVDGDAISIQGAIPIPIGHTADTVSR